MEFALMPSEIARLVYGNCHKTANIFLEESPHLKEFSVGIKMGRRYSTIIREKTLIQMLNRDPNEASKFQVSTNNNKLKTTKRFDNLTTKQIENYISMLQKVIDGLSLAFNTNSTEMGIKINVQENNSIKSSINDKSANEVKQNAFYSPRRKGMTPKRIDDNSNSDMNQEIATNENDCVQSLDESQMHSPAPSSGSNESLEIGEDFYVDPKLIYDELLNCKPLQEKLADKINILSNEQKKETLDQSNSNKSTTNTLDSVQPNDLTIGNLEKDLLAPDLMEEILNTILNEPVCTELVEVVIGKEILSNNLIQPRQINSNLASNIENEQHEPLTNDLMQTQKSNSLIIDIDSIASSNESNKSSKNISSHSTFISSPNKHLQDLKTNSKPLREIIPRKNNHFKKLQVNQMIVQKSKISEPQELRKPNDSNNNKVQSVITLPNYFIPINSTTTSEQTIVSGASLQTLFFPTVSNTIIYDNTNSLINISNSSEINSKIKESTRTYSSLDTNLQQKQQAVNVFKSPTKSTVDNNKLELKTVNVPEKACNFNLSSEPSNQKIRNMPAILRKSKQQKEINKTIEVIDLEKSTDKNLTELKRKKHDESEPKKFDNKRATRFNHDPTIKTLLDVDMEKFLGNIHKKGNK
ncbi:hypothetical protein BLOT_009469 [Blomia tropicalis]|nr:hypothetical protein BLOT_009469 [Blomia tropicalis]